MKQLFIAASALAMLAACTTTDTSASSDTGDFQTADGTKVECRRIKEMGTRLGKRVCMEKQEWAEVDRAAEEAAEDFMGSNRGAGEGASSPGL